MSERTLGVVIRFHRLMHNLTEKELATMCGVAPSTIFFIETRNRASDKTLIKIANVLNIDAMELIELKRREKEL